MVLDFHETICLLTSGRVQGAKKTPEIKKLNGRGQGGEWGEERKTDEGAGDQNPEPGLREGNGINPQEGGAWQG